MQATIHRTTAVHRSARVRQLESLFDVPPSIESRLSWHVDLPVEERPWHLGLIVGPSGSGKSTIARELFARELVTGFAWSPDRALIDDFPASMGIKDITLLLSSVGFSSPPSWLRPFAVLSTGEQFRATVARALAEAPDLAVIDEFTSVVDRTVAQIGAAAIAKTVRRRGRKLVAVTCHYDVIDWLQPDWIYEPSAVAVVSCQLSVRKQRGARRLRTDNRQPTTGNFQWRSLCPRPSIALDVSRGTTDDWRQFKAHHYLSGDIHRSAKCFVGRIGGRLAAFVAVVHFCHPVVSAWREHRAVVLPDFQGVGIGNRLSEYVAGLFRATGKQYRAVTGHPAMIRHRLNSPLWRITRMGEVITPRNSESAAQRASRSFGRVTWGFEFRGSPNVADAVHFGLV